jgi:hypothetical protein
LRYLTSPEVAQLVGFDNVGSGLLWSSVGLARDHTLDLKYEVEKNLLMLAKHLDGDRASCGLPVGF